MNENLRWISGFGQEQPVVDSAKQSLDRPLHSEAGLMAYANNSAIAAVLAGLCEFPICASERGLTIKTTVPCFNGSQFPTEPTRVLLRRRGSNSHGKGCKGARRGGCSPGLHDRREEDWGYPAGRGSFTLAPREGEALSGFCGKVRLSGRTKPPTVGPARDRRN